MLKSLGQILIEKNKITEEDLEKGLVHHEKEKIKLGESLVKLNFIEEHDLLEVLSEQLDVPIINFDEVDLKPEIAQIITEKMAFGSFVLPIEETEDTILVAMADPLNTRVIQDIEYYTGGKQVEIRLASKKEILQLLEVYFESYRLLKLTKDIKDEKVDFDDDTDEESPVVKLSNIIFNDGYYSRASDIHIEPQENKIRIRYRVDGVLCEKINLPKRIEKPLISRIKIMAQLDISETKIPQDGRIKMTSDKGDELDLRISTLPTLWGEKIVARILDKGNLELDIKTLGFLEKDEVKLAEMLSNSYGLLLLTGPTGSGKTTTLYSGLKNLDCKTNNIITVEDPIEYQLKDINQVQTNNKAGLNFASALKSILRQDPDIIMIGEIRDKETAEIAINAAMTGHLVLSTLHTNKAAEVVTRLDDMGVEPFLVSRALIGSVGQRLVRTICPHCKTKEREINERIENFKNKNGIKELYKGKGCPKCSNSGYRGRTVLAELLEVDEKIERKINQRPQIKEIEKLAREKGFVSIEEVGIKKIKEGITTLEEVLRVSNLKI